MPIEVKWDGFRALINASPKGVTAWSRNGYDMTSRYPELAALADSVSTRVILDGEIVCLVDGRPDFAALWFRSRGSSTPPVCFMAFDLLEIDGRELADERYRERRRMLEELDLSGPHWCTPEIHVGEGAALFVATKEMGLEGVVAKRLDSRYRTGLRSKSWTKTKHFQTRNFALLGWLPPEEWRQDRGCVVLGLHSEAGIAVAGVVESGYERDLVEQLPVLARGELRSLQQPDRVWEGDDPIPGCGEVPRVERRGRTPSRGHRFVERHVSRTRAEEEWARRIISSALDADVQLHDTGAAASMYDLQVMYTDGSRAAAEVVAAADPESISLWRVVDDDSADRWQVDGLVGGWSATLDPSARGKRVLAELPGICGRLENLGLKDVRDSPDASYEFAQSLGIRSLRQGGTDFPGSIYVIVEQPPERTGGMVPQTVDPLAEWLTGFLEHNDRRDIRAKLAGSGLAERHAVVFVPSLSTAPYPVMDLLFRNDAPSDGAFPTLPVEITDVWTFSSWTSGLAFHWSPSNGWMQFPKL